MEPFLERYLKKLVKKLIGNNDIEDALKRLDRLTQEEARMASAQLMEVTNTINNRVEEIADNILGADNTAAREVIQQAADGVDRMERSWFPDGIHAGHAGSTILTGSQLRQNLCRWLSPSDPSTNHNIACNAHHKGTATWFFEGRMYKEWKSTGCESLLWIHGKRAPLSHSWHSATRRHLMLILICSWLRQEYTLVRTALLYLSKTTESLIVFQLRNHPRY